MQLEITKLLIYPIKSLAGIALDEAKVERKGLAHDRRWMLVDNDHGHITQRTHPVMALLQPAIEGGRMTITHKQKPEVQFSFGLEEVVNELLTVTVWGDTCEAYEVSAEASAWFTKQLGSACKLVKMPEEFVRPTDPDFSATADDKVSFADGYPLLIFDEASVALIREKSGAAIYEDRFRGNIIFKGGHAHIEDELKRFSINHLDFYGSKPCTRCVLTTVNQDTAEKGKEPLKTLATYRLIDNKIKFGQNVIPLNEGTIQVGDHIIVKETTEPIRF